MKRIKYFLLPEYTFKQKFIALWYLLKGFLTWNPVSNWFYYNITLRIRHFHKTATYEKRNSDYIRNRQNDTPDDILVEVTDEQLLFIKSKIEFQQI